ncbi:protein mono-ADP-ribosyltransferase PARP12 isoform X2 [Syngnathoides biaculeatus]|uniref:protein mono-ADP-ribosyltransferase PARP12 isoform X2 n=1 Tax=Syngnathoides biaculeatus TaxID=300417 RepID=UPI002ADE0DA3|nr:protein mono-ADP-ribosyltransferase PARP12 isoform X2 [Syngnathoides biaculeatus]
MTKPVSNYVIQTLCDDHGSSDFRVLTRKLEQRFGVAASVLHRVLSDEARIAVKKGVLAVGPGQILSQDSVVVAKTTLRICQRRPGQCIQCDSLHLCKFYVLGTCLFGSKCKHPHMLTCSHNAELLTKLDLQHLSEKQLFQLLLQNDPYLLPEICSHYNTGEGESGLCAFTSQCRNLHVCKPHVTTGVCKQGASCPRIHNIDSKVHKSFENLSQEMIKTLPKVYRNKCIIADQLKGPATAAPEARCPAGSKGATKPVRDSDKEEICIFFIRKLCTYKEKCFHVHWHLPYRWQLLDCDGVTWKDLTDMEEIEKAYCDPARDSSSIDQARLRNAHVTGTPETVRMPLVDFIGMTCNGSPVRRLSTASSVTKASHFILTTQWLWYWKDDIGKWQEFGKSEINTPASLTSETLEKIYLEDQKTQITFSAGKYKYVMHFRDEAGARRLYQKNLILSTKREVRRRPRFVSSHHGEMCKRQRDQMKKRNGGKPVSEQYLFHGTSANFINDICEQNFDWRISGIHGTAFGKGSYFAKHASYSNRYIKARGVNKSMFVALVLVGDYTKGSSQFARPPAKGNSTILYDSCVDDVKNPNIFVIFEKQQIYPEFLIDYSE